MSHPTSPKELLKLSESDLAVMLGAAILQTTLGGKPASNEEKEALGRHWFSQKHKDLASRFCGDPRVKSYLVAQDGRRRTEIVAAIADLIAGAIGGMPPFVVATMLIHYGLDSICKEFK